MLEVKNVSKSYLTKTKISILRNTKKKKQAINNVSLTIPRGKIIGVLGENGAGKTTLIKMMTTLLKQDSGEITINGIDINDNLKATRSKINIISGGERNLYWRLTAMENLMYFGSLYGIERSTLKDRAAQLLKEVGLWDSKDIPVEQYSKGMKQRLQIAKGLINNPEYLFLDEPTLGLDVRIAKELRDKIQSIAVQKNTGVLLTTHYMAEAEELCDYLYIIEKGEIVLKGTKAEVFEQLSLKNEAQIIIDLEISSDKLEKMVTTIPGMKFSDTREGTVCSVQLDSIKLEYIISVFNDNNINISQIKLLEPSLEKALLKFKDLGLQNEK